MRTDEERIEAMHRRAGQMARESRKQRAVIMQTAASVIGFAAVIVFALLVPGIVVERMPEILPESMNASIFSRSSALGFIVTGIIAFLLGVTVSVFCFRVRKWEEEQKTEEMYDR